MLKQILLLTPVYVTLFWSITLNTDPRKYSNPRLFLGKFMLFAFVVYLSHFLFFTPYPKIYFYIDPLYQYASLLVYPLYYIYFRLLTIDNKFSLKLHYPYLIAPTLLFLLHSFGILITPTEEFKAWTYNHDFQSGSFGIQFLNIIHLLIRICFLVQVIATIIGNYLLIKKHGDKASQYYSDLEESSTVKVSLLNYSMIVTGLASIILGALGRNFFTDQTTGIAIVTLVFSVMLYIIGWLGDKQKALNPSFEITPDCDKASEFDDLSFGAQKIILDKLLILFNERKVFLDSKLTIQEIAQSVCTNRTYISTIINQNFNQNFCTFVNNYRVEELNEVIKKHPEYTNQILAESCGFGSVDSLKRAVMSKTNKPLQEWKNEVISGRQ